MEEVSREDNKNSAAIKLTGTPTMISMIVLLVVMVFVISLYFYAKWFWWQGLESGHPGRYSTRQGRRFVFAPGQDNDVPLRRGLDPTILKSLPVVVFSTEEFNEVLECAVCLCEVVQGEKARFLPKCNHGFHVGCVDMWFQSHSTCPLCRNGVAIENSGEGVSSLEGNSGLENPSYPTNVLFWGNENRVSSRSVGLEEGPGYLACSAGSGDSRPVGMLVIDIPPRQMNEGLGLSSMSPLSSRVVEEEAKSPMTTRRRSFKRLLSRENSPSPSSSCSGDLERVGKGGS